MISLESGLTVRNQDFSLVLSHQEPARVIVAVPHDGLIKNDLAGLFKIRENGWRGRDAYAWPIANDVVQKSLALGVRVDAVRLLMPRAYVDGNREMPTESNLDPDTRGQTALDDPLLASVYRTYHGEISRLIERSIAAYGVENLLFIDLHGFGLQPKIAPARGYDLILGTANRATIHHGEADRELARFMEGRGYSVFLPAEQPVTPRGDPFSAGHTTRWYAKRYGVNAIQIETFSIFRRRESQSRGEKLASDLSEFFSQRYL